MNEYVAKITLDLNCQATPVVISAGQFDIGRKIQITLTADGEAYDATGATAVCKGKSGSNYFAVNATVAKNIVTVTTDKAMLSSAGRTVAKIVLTDGTRTYSTQPFVINTHGDYDGDITTSDYYPELLDILSRVIALTESGAVLTDTNLSATSVNPLQNKVLTPIINTINNRLQSAEQNLHSKANATDVSNALKSKEDNSNKVSSKTDITDSSTNYPSVKYLDDYYYGANEIYSSEETDELLGNKADKATTLAGYGITDAYTKEDVQKKLNKKLDSMPFDSEPKQNSPCYLTSGTVYNALQTKADVNSVYSKTETDNSLREKADKADVDTALMNKADLINSLNIFDFDVWAKGLQGLTTPVYRGTLDKVDYSEKSITFTGNEARSYTNGWNSAAPQSMRITVKPNTKYLFSCLPSSKKCEADVFLNGVTANHFELKGGFGSFTTAEDTTYILIRFVYSEIGFFKVSKIMITEKESIYLPNKVAEGVPEVANEVFAFEKTAQASLDGKYDSSNIESGTSKLTPHSNVADIIKSASCVYKTIGDIVIINATITMNAITMGANNTYPLIDLPYKCISDSNVYCVGITSNNKLFKFTVPKNNTWLQFQSQDKTAYTFADGEQINVICSYKIK